MTAKVRLPTELFSPELENDLSLAKYPPVYAMEAVSKGR